MDFSLYAGLRGTDNWKQRRADEQYNARVQEIRTQKQQQKTAKQMQYQEYYHKYMGMLDELKVLGADQERIKQAELEARRSVVDGVAKHGGDATRFMQGGGITILEGYKNNLMNDKRVQRAISNKSNYAEILKAKSEGKFINQVPVRLAVKGEDGKQKIDPKTGQPVFETKMVDATEQIGMHDQGFTDRILFMGAEDNIPVSYADFWKHKKPHDPNDPYSKNTAVTEQEVYTFLLENKASPDQARFKAKAYGDQVRGGMSPWDWFKGDELDHKLKKAQLSNTYKRGKLLSKQIDAANYDWVYNQKTNLMESKNNPNQVYNSGIFGEKNKRNWLAKIGAGENPDKGTILPDNAKLVSSFGSDKSIHAGDMLGDNLISSSWADEQLEYHNGRAYMKMNYVLNDIPASMVLNDMSDDVVAIDGGDYYKYQGYYDVTPEFQNATTNVDDTYTFNFGSTKSQGKDVRRDRALWSEGALGAQQDLINMSNR